MPFRGTRALVALSSLSAINSRIARIKCWGGDVDIPLPEKLRDTIAVGPEASPLSSQQSSFRPSLSR